VGKAKGMGRKERIGGSRDGRELIVERSKGETNGVFTLMISEISSEPSEYHPPDRPLLRLTVL
jgi:hypothetical protein